MLSVGIFSPPLFIAFDIADTFGGKSLFHFKVSPQMILNHYAQCNRLYKRVPSWCLLELKILIPTNRQIFQPSFHLIKKLQLRLECPLSVLELLTFTLADSNKEGLDMFTFSIICCTVNISISMFHQILGTASQILSLRDLLKMFPVKHNYARLGAEICTNWQYHCIYDVLPKQYLGYTACSAFLDHLSFVMPFHQIVESCLTFCQEGLVPQLAIYC